MELTAKELQEGSIILVNKPLNWTSFSVVNKMKWEFKNKFKFKKIKIGHAGTLDPRATGLLIICTGKATKKISEIQNAQKEYIAEIKIGAQTESYDTEKPEILHKDISKITEEHIRNTLKTFTGKIQQRPPIFSAIKIDGKRAYNLARAGKDIEINLREVFIHYINNININFPYISLCIGCSKGTYIRSLAHDIGQKLGVGAYLTNLHRTKIGDYRVENAQNYNILS